MANRRFVKLFGSKSDPDMIRNTSLGFLFTKYSTWVKKDNITHTGQVIAVF